jgi:hypothetical protein
MFTGGTDVNPALYGEPAHPKTQAPDNERDKGEKLVFQESVSLGRRMIGICRGAQFLCVMAGGKLVQHQENSGRHLLTIHDDAPDTSDFGNMLVVSDHHQAQWPWLILFRLLSYTNQLSPFHHDGNGEEMVNGWASLCEWGGGRAGNNLLEVEDAYYPTIKALAIQTHPEWLDPRQPEEAKTIAHYQKLLELLMRDEL